MEEWGDFPDSSINESWFNPSPPKLDDFHNELSSEENKQFANALTKFDPPTFFENLTFRVPSKSIQETKSYYQGSVDDIGRMINVSGLIHQPVSHQTVQSAGLKQAETSKGSLTKHHKGAAIRRKRRTPWTEEEHRSFLKGVDEYGKGDWRSISRYCVPSRTPAQVASHAQKYYQRQQTSLAEKRRPCINDINNVTSTTTNVVPTTTIATTSTQQYTHGNAAENTEQMPPLYSSFPYNNMMSNSNNNLEQNYYSPSLFPSAMTSTIFPQANLQPTTQTQSSTSCPYNGSSMYDWS